MQLKPQISQMDTDYQGILYFEPVTLRVNGRQVLLDLHFSVSVPSVLSVANLNC
jgi:hypothetical protein